MRRFDRLRRLLLLLVALVTIAGCGAKARLPVSAGVGPHPTLPAPDTSLIPTIEVVDAKGWPEGMTPSAAAGTKVVALARGLDHPRWLYVLPNGDVLVAETNAPPRPEDGKGIKDGSSNAFRRKPVAPFPVQTASRCSVTRTAMV